MSRSFAEPNTDSLPEGLDAILREAAQRAAPVDPKSRWEIDVREVIQELTRPWDRCETDRNVLHPEIIDVRDRGGSPVLLSGCPVCDDGVGTPTFEIRGLTQRLVTCRTCGLGRLDPMPSPQEIEDFYPAEYYGSPGAKFEPLTEAVVRAVGTYHVRALTRRLARGSRILDVGCGRGILLGALADRGYEVHGVDVSETAVCGADLRAVIRIAPCLIKVGYPDRYFDQVIIWHVLEHLPNPREVLREIHRILKPCGQVIVAVPNFSSRQARWAGPAWFHLDLPRHLFHFPAAGLRLLLRRTGFEILREQHFSLRQNPFGWVQSALNRVDALPRNALYHLLHNRSTSGGTERADVERIPLWRRQSLRAAYFAGMPLAAALSAWDAVTRSGATICLVGRAT